MLHLNQYRRNLLYHTKLAKLLHLRKNPAKFNLKSSQAKTTTTKHYFSVGLPVIASVGPPSCLLLWVCDNKVRLQVEVKTSHLDD